MGPASRPRVSILAVTWFGRMLRALGVELPLEPEASTPQAPPPRLPLGADDVLGQGVARIWSVSRERWREYKDVAPIDWSVSDPLHPPDSKISSLVDAYLGVLGREFSAEEEGILKHAIWGTYQHSGQTGVTPSTQVLVHFLMSWVEYVRNELDGAERAGAEWDVARLERLQRELTRHLIKPLQNFRKRRQDFGIPSDRVGCVVVLAQGLVYSYEGDEDGEDGDDHQLVTTPERKFVSAELLGSLPWSRFLFVGGSQWEWERREFETLRRMNAAALEEVAEAERAREPSLAALARTLASRRSEFLGPPLVAAQADDPPRGFDDERAPDYDAALVPIEEGDVVTGQVVGIGQEEVLVDIGFDCVGVIPSTELSVGDSVDPADEVSLGEEFEALVLIKEARDGRPVLSKKRARRETAWKRIEAAAKSGKPVEGTVVEVAGDGLRIDLGGLVGFMDKSDADIHSVRLENFVGQMVEGKVIRLDSEKWEVDIELSRRAVLEEQRERERQPAKERQRRREIEWARRQGADESRLEELRQEQATGEREEHKRHELACRQLRDAVDDAAETLGQAAVQSLLDSYGRGWLSEVNARRESEGLTRFKNEAVVEREARAALSVIGYDPVLEDDFGAAVGKARFVLGVTNATHHPSDLPDDAKLADAQGQLNELCEVAQHLMHDA